MKCVWEHHGDDTLLFSCEHIGAYTRGKTLQEAMAKMQDEINSFLLWKKEPPQTITLEIVQEKESELQIADADSDVLFDSEKEPLTMEEYQQLKALALQSARDFLALYASIPDQRITCMPPRNTFYGPVPRTAEEMYIHTKNVNAYYFSEIDVDADNEGDIFTCRKIGFEKLECTPHFLDNRVIHGSYGEQWTVRKVLRRFLWHDRIHAKAMYRMACKCFGQKQVANPFRFTL